MTAIAMARTSRRMPDFAGVALVDILANGVAMLIIVVVVSIAARMEREERHAEQASEVAAVMSHKFSTSLVLNSLAASPPARLHDYENSPLDRVLDPAILPILELHGGFVREFYSGAIWTRGELLRERSGFDAWIARLDALQRARLRVDVYDVPQFYVTMSILREHGIRVFHWHFLPGALSRREAERCPRGIAAKDCAGGEDGAPVPLPQLALDDRDSGGLGGPDSPLYEPPSGLGQGSGGAGATPGFEPDGAGLRPGPPSGRRRSGNGRHGGRKVRGPGVRWTGVRWTGGRGTGSRRTGGRTTGGSVRSRTGGRRCGR